MGLSICLSIRLWKSFVIDLSSWTVKQPHLQFNLLITWSVYYQPIGNSAVEALDLLNAVEPGEVMAASLFTKGWVKADWRMLQAGLNFVQFKQKFIKCPTGYDLGKKKPGSFRYSSFIVIKTPIMAPNPPWIVCVISLLVYHCLNAMWNRFIEVIWSDSSQD